MPGAPLADPRFLKARRALEEAVSYQQQGLLAQSEKAYARVVGKFPDYFDALHFYGLFKYQQGKPSDAFKLVAKATKLNPRSANAFNSLGVILGALKRHEEALGSFDTALGLDRNHVPALSNRGNSLNELQRYQDAIASTDRALAIDPNYSEACIPRGAALLASKRPSEALESYERALKLNPNLAVAWLGRGNALCELKRYAEALTSYDRALALKPDDAEFWLARGHAFSALRRYDEALAAYRRALVSRPDLFEALSAVVSLLLAQGNAAEAMTLARRALSAGATSEAKALVAACLCSPLMSPGQADLRDVLLWALSEPWTRPSLLAPACIQVLALNPAIRDGVARVATAWPNRLLAKELAGAAGLVAIADDRLLRALLESAPICDVGLERLLTVLRASLLEAAQVPADGPVSEPMLAFYCALARQCFINFYVFAQSDLEIEQARVLREALVAALGSGAAVPALLLVAVAACVPLHTLPGAERLLDLKWPAVVKELLAQQVGAPIEEQRLRAAISALTEIDDVVSMQVRSQYEENPFPQWVQAV